jgi:uncharacterized protein (TIGR00730 family)
MEGIMKNKSKPVKAYRNTKFLNSRDARTIRILSEYYEPLSRFKKYGIKNSIVFFGSARAKNHSSLQNEFEQNGMDTIKDEELKKQSQYKLRLAYYYDNAVLLAKKLTTWAMDPQTGKQSHYICSGGGPGIMEAANKGAKLAGGKSIGLNISIPSEQYPNAFISEELLFEFHYFFIRKFWFIYLAKALVIFPGGFGTMDELMEVITLIQTNKLQKKLPIVIFGTEFWNKVLNLDLMTQWGTIDEHDLKLLYFSDDIEEAYQYLIKRLKK